MEMVSITPLCVASLLATCNPLTTEIATTEGDSDQQSTYDTVDSQQINEWMGEVAMQSPYTPRSVLEPEVIKYLVGYQEYVEEQERLQLEELERQRQEELERQRQEELERQRQAEEARQRGLASYTHKGYRQTYYSVAEGETNLGAGYNYQSKEIAVINNVMNFYDKDYGYLPIYAININEVLGSGLNSKGTPNLYGSVIQIKDSNGNISKGIVLDACGACSRANKIDLWVYNNNQVHDVSNLEFKYIRKGWNDYVAY